MKTFPFRALFLGLLLAALFGIANVYLALKAGQTIAATIPAALVGLTIFRLLGRSAPIEDQIVIYTSASVGAAAVAGAIFIIPAFISTDPGSTLWSDLRLHYWDFSLLIASGGLLGVIVTAPLCRPLFADKTLPWPESVATVDLIKAGANAGSPVRRAFQSVACGALLEVFTSPRGLGIITPSMRGVVRLPPLRSSTTQGASTSVAWSTPTVSAALFATGYLMGLPLAASLLAGGVIGTFVLSPLFGLASGLPAGGEVNGVSSYVSWVRAVGVGTMIAALLKTAYVLRGTVVDALKNAFATEEKNQRRDLSSRTILVLTVCAGLLVISVFVSNEYTVLPSVVNLVQILVLTLLLSLVGGHLVGLVGGNNQPLSGLILLVVLASAIMASRSLQARDGALVSVLVIATVVAIAVSVSGSLMQDVRAADALLGCRWKLQVASVAVVVAMGPIVTMPIIALHEANASSGGIGGFALPAPQASLMAQLASGIVLGGLPWTPVVVGFVLGLALILGGAKFPMLVAVGIYLPFETTAAMFLGGGLRWLRDRSSLDSSRMESGTILASGLIAGEAIANVLLAAFSLAGVAPIRELVPIPKWLSGHGDVFALGAVALCWYLLVKTPLKEEASVRR